MQKIKISELQEILASHLTSSHQYLEAALSVFMDDFMEVSSGVITGLEVTQSASGTVSVSSGHIFQDGVFGTLEAASGVALTLPISGTTTGLITAYYDEIEDTVVSGYMLMDVSSALETIEELPSRLLGAVICEHLANTDYASRPSTKIPLAIVVTTSAGISSITDVRIYARAQRLQQDFQQTWKNLYFAAMY